MDGRMDVGGDTVEIYRLCFVYPCTSTLDAQLFCFYSQSLLKQLIVETRDSYGLTVAELLAQHYSVYREMIIKLNTSELVMNTVSDIWPLQFDYMESLLHYIVSGG